MKTWTCRKCTVSHEVATPHYHRTQPYHRCPECGLRYWSAASAYSNPVRMGVNPADLESFLKAKGVA